MPAGALRTQPKSDHAQRASPMLSLQADEDFGPFHPHLLAGLELASQIQFLLGLPQAAGGPKRDRPWQRHEQISPSLLGQTPSGGSKEPFVVDLQFVVLQ